MLGHRPALVVGFVRQSRFGLLQSLAWSGHHFVRPDSRRSGIVGYRRVHAGSLSLRRPFWWPQRNGHWRVDRFLHRTVSPSLYPFGNYASRDTPMRVLDPVRTRTRALLLYVA